MNSSHSTAKWIALLTNIFLFINTRSEITNNSYWLFVLCYCSGRNNICAPEMFFVFGNSSQKCKKLRIVRERQKDFACLGVYFQSAAALRKSFWNVMLQSQGEISDPYQWGEPLLKAHQTESGTYMSRCPKMVKSTECHVRQRRLLVSVEWLHNLPLSRFCLL